MSKLQVNNILQSKNSKSDTALTSLLASLQRGRKINIERCQRADSEVQFAKFRSNDERDRKRNRYICKIVYPHEAVYPVCDHTNTPIPNRTKFTQKEHTDFLSQPKWYYRKPVPKFVGKIIPPCTARINSLSQPIKRRLFITLATHRHHFTYSRLEVLLRRIYMAIHQTPEQALLAAKQRLRDRRKKVRAQKYEIQRLKRKIDKNRKLQELSLCKFKDLMLNDLTAKRVREPENLEHFILVRLCQMTKHKVPDVQSVNQVDRAYLKLAKRFALQVYLKSKEPQESDCRKKLKSHCYPIQSYYQKVLEKDSSASIGVPASISPVKSSSSAHHSTIAESGDDEGDMFVIDSETRLKLLQECTELNEKLQKDAALNEIKKKGLAEKRAVHAAQRREESLKMATGKKGASGGADDDDDVDDGEGGRRRRERKEGESTATAEQKWEVEWEDRKSSLN